MIIYEIDAKNLLFFLELFFNAFLCIFFFFAIDLFRIDCLLGHHNRQSEQLVFDLRNSVQSRQSCLGPRIEPTEKVNLFFMKNKKK